MSSRKIIINEKNIFKIIRINCSMKVEKRMRNNTSPNPIDLIKCLNYREINGNSSIFKESNNLLLFNYRQREFFYFFHTSFFALRTELNYRDFYERGTNSIEFLNILEKRSSCPSSTSLILKS